MNVFERIWRAAKANFNAWFERIERPEQTLERSLQQMQKQVNHLREDVIRIVAEEKKLKNQLERNQKEAERWEKNAVLALKQNNETLAREALRRKRETLELIQQLNPQWEKQQQIAERLKQEYQALHERIQTAQRKKQTLVLRLKNAESQKRLQNLLTELSDTNVFDRFEQKVLETENINAAQSELQAASLDGQFAALGSASDISVDAELEALKERMKLNP